MARYFLKRCLVALPTLFGISIVVFCLVQLTPGGPVEHAIEEMRHASIGGESGGGRAAAITEEQRQLLVELYGFDKPLPVRYARWIGQLARFDFGESYYYSEPVATLLASALPVSLGFGLASFFITYLVCIPLGVLKALRNGSRFDVASSAFVFLLYSMPPFALAIFLVVLFAGGSFWNFFPAQGLVSDGFAELGLFAKVRDVLHHAFLPLVCYTVGAFATLTMIVKNSLLEQLGQDYVTAARAKGLPERIVIVRHALRNALLPVASGLAQWLSVFFMGSLLVETVFGLRGVGRLSYDAVLNRDYPIVLANIMILSTINVVGNLLSDLLYVAIDPRIDFA